MQEPIERPAATAKRSKDLSDRAHEVQHQPQRNQELLKEDGEIARTISRSRANRDRKINAAGNSGNLAAPNVQKRSRNQRIRQSDQNMFNQKHEESAEEH